MLRLRPPTPADVADLARVHVAAWRAAYRGIIPDAVLRALSEESFARTWAHRLTHEPRSTLLAEARGEVVGFGVAGPSRDPDATGRRVGELHALYLLPEHWDTGAGWRLWQAMRRLLVVEEFPEATLWVLEANRRARTFYERAGFSLDPDATRQLDRGGARLTEVRYRIGLE